MITNQKIYQECEDKGIPFEHITELLDYLGYADTYTVALKLLMFTGCRISELDHMYMDHILDGYIYWKTGKTGKSRKEFLPDEFINEINVYRTLKRVHCKTVIHVKSQTFRRKFNLNIRPNLGHAWNNKKPFLRKGGFHYEFKLQLKGFRKNFATLLFMYFWNKYNDPTLAALMVSKRMVHSSQHITANHYIQTTFDISAKDCMGLMPFEILPNVKQTRIADFFY
jgi:integrase